jgi:hypothetical protein
MSKQNYCEVLSAGMDAITLKVLLTGVVQCAKLNVQHLALVETLGEVF